MTSIRRQVIQQAVNGCSNAVMDIYGEPGQLTIRFLGVKMIITIQKTTHGIGVVIMFARLTQVKPQINLAETRKSRPRWSALSSSVVSTLTGRYRMKQFNHSLILPSRPTAARCAVSSCGQFCASPSEKQISGKIITKIQAMLTTCILARETAGRQQGERLHRSRFPKGRGITSTYTCIRAGREDGLHGGKWGHFNQG